MLIGVLFILEIEESIRAEGDRENQDGDGSAGKGGKEQAVRTKPERKRIGG